MNNKFDEKLDTCYDWIMSKIRDPYNHKYETELIDDAIFKFADRTNYKKELAKSLEFMLSNRLF